jgi:hypothetical protein
MARGWMRFKNELPDWRFGGGVYALYRESRLIYVGHSGNVRDRLLNHRRRFSFDVAKVAPTDDRRERQRLERKLLFRLRPSCNGTLPTVLRPVGFYKGC